MQMRRLTAIMAVLALTATACGGDDGDTAPGEGEEAPPNQEEEDSEAAPTQGGTFTTIVTRLEATAPPNPFTPDTLSFQGYNAMMLAWVRNHPTQTDAFYPGLAESWDFAEDKSELIVNLHPDATWSDGAPVTADDVVVSTHIAYTRGSGAFILSPGAAGTASDVEVIDEKTLRFTQDPEAPTNTFINGILGTTIVPAHVFGHLIPDDFEQTLEAARGDDDAAEAAREEIAGLADDVVEFAPEVDVSAGPFVLERVNPSEALLVRNEHFHNNELVAPDQVVVRNYTGNEQIWNYLTAGELDFSQFVAITPDVKEQIIAVDGNRISQTYSPVVAGMAFNQAYEPFDDIRVRRALAYILDREQMVSVANPDGGTAPITTSGIHGDVLADWIGDAVNELDPYALDLEAAAAELEDYGMTNENGSWLLPSGEPFEVPIQVVDGFSDWIASGENMSTQLAEFGITSEIRTAPDFTVYQEEMAAGEYPVGFWLIGLGPSPYNIMQRLYGASNGWTVSQGQLDYSAPGENGNWMGGPETLEIEGHGEINPGELAHELNTASQERVPEIMEILAKATNENLPVIQAWDYINTQFDNTSRYLVEPPDDARRITGVTNQAGVWMQQGWVTLAQ